jgi:hypothetical protein
MNETHALDSHHGLSHEESDATKSSETIRFSVFSPLKTVNQPLKMKNHIVSSSKNNEKMKRHDVYDMHKRKMRIQPDVQTKNRKNAGTRTVRHIIRRNRTPKTPKGDEKMKYKLKSEEEHQQTEETRMYFNTTFDAKQFEHEAELWQKANPRPVEKVKQQ